MRFRRYSGRARLSMSRDERLRRHTEAVAAIRRAVNPQPATKPEVQKAMQSPEQPELFS